eukprot:4881760-Heterocapsa_arctica.AAC.1
MLAGFPLPVVPVATLHTTSGLTTPVMASLLFPELDPCDSFYLRCLRGGKFCMVDGRSFETSAASFPSGDSNES